MKQEVKPWGICYPLLMTEDIQVDRLSIKSGGYSSLHYHRRKINQFTVISGELTIYCINQAKQIVDEVVITDDQHFVCRNGVEYTHQFYCRVPTAIYEFYWHDRGVREHVEREDIVRFTENGRGDFVPPDIELWKRLARGVADA